jgi:hypothetical protein
MTRKEFVLNIVEELKTNPRAVLAGHGIQAAVLQTIIGRPDVMSKLASVLYSTVYAKKGAAGLKKAVNFKISGYKSFADFNMKAREDVETFIGGLSPEDSASFTNADNILTILLLPETANTGEESLTTEIISGKSVALTFDTAVRKEYKLGNGMYLTVMLGASAARPTEEKIAERKEKVNKKKQIRRTPAKIMSDLKRKANKKLGALKTETSELENTAYKTELELEQFNNNGSIYGGNKIDNAAIRERKAAIDKEITRLSSSNGLYLNSLGLETDEKKKLSLRSMISKNNTKIKELRIKLGTYENLSPRAMSKKAMLLADTHAAIEANIAKGQAISEALNNALASLNIKPAQQEILKQEIMQQVAAGTPMQYAVQQAVQQTFVYEIPETSLSGNFEIEKLLNTL